MLYHRHGLILFSPLGENVDPQGLFLIGKAEKGNGLLIAVRIQVLQLYRLDQFPGQWRGVLPALSYHLTQPALQRLIVF